MRVHRATSLNALHFLAAAVANGPWALRPGSPFLDALSILIPSWETALPANTLALVIYSWESARG